MLAESRIGHKPCVQIDPFPVYLGPCRWFKCALRISIEYNGNDKVSGWVYGSMGVNIEFINWREQWQIHFKRLVVFWIMVKFQQGGPHFRYCYDELCDFHAQSGRQRSYKFFLWFLVANEWWIMVVCTFVPMLPASGADYVSTPVCINHPGCELFDRTAMTDKHAKERGRDARTYGRGHIVREINVERIQNG